MADAVEVKAPTEVKPAELPAEVAEAQEVKPAEEKPEEKTEEKEEEEKKPEGNKYEFNVKMSCGGCSGAITRVLKKLEAEGGVKSFEVSLEKQTAVVHADDSLPYETVLAKIQNTGKTVTDGWANGEKRSVAKVEAAA